MDRWEFLGKEEEKNEKRTQERALTLVGNWEKWNQWRDMGRNGQRGRINTRGVWVSQNLGGSTVLRRKEWSPVSNAMTKVMKMNPQKVSIESDSMESCWCQMEEVWVEWEGSVDNILKKYQRNGGQERCFHRWEIVEPICLLMQMV